MSYDTMDYISFVIWYWEGNNGVVKCKNQYLAEDVSLISIGGTSLRVRDRIRCIRSVFSGRTFDSTLSLRPLAFKKSSESGCLS